MRWHLLRRHTARRSARSHAAPRLLPLAATLVLAAGLLASGTTVADGGEVNVYSYRQPFLIKPIFNRFTEQSGIRVNTVFAQEGLVERLENEGDNSPADLIFTVDIGRLDGAVGAGVTQRVESELLEARIPEEFRDPEQHWFGLTNRARLIVKASTRVDDQLVTAYEDLADPALQGRICTRSGKHEYMVALIASMIAHHGRAETKTWLEAVKGNLARKPQGNDRAQARAIAQGECDVAIINSYYLGAMTDDPEQRGWVEALDVVFPNQSSPFDRGTHMNISGMALTRAAPNRDNAIALMEFLASDIAQQLYAEQNHEYPVNPQVPSSELVQSWGSFSTDPLALAEIARHRAEASRLVDEVGYDN